MPKASWMMLLTIGMLLSASGSADDAKFSNTDSETLPEATLPLDGLHAELGHTSRWHSFDSVEAMAYSGDWPRAIADFDFQDDSALARVSKLRNLSLLTLVEIGQTRLFLGVNDEGLLGLHFNAFPRDGDGRYLEVVRMPYLKENEPDSHD
jgi:hypothetical protein